MSGICSVLADPGMVSRRTTKILRNFRPVAPKLQGKTNGKQVRRMVNMAEDMTCKFKIDEISRAISKISQRCNGTFFRISSGELHGCRRPIHLYQNEKSNLQGAEGTQNSERSWKHGIRKETHYSFEPKLKAF